MHDVVITACDADELTRGIAPPKSCRNSWTMCAAQRTCIALSAAICCKSRSFPCFIIFLLVARCCLQGCQLLKVTFFCVHGCCFLLQGPACARQTACWAWRQHVVQRCSVRRTYFPTTMLLCKLHASIMRYQGTVHGHIRRAAASPGLRCHIRHLKIDLTSSDV